MKPVDLSRKEQYRLAVQEANNQEALRRLAETEGEAAETLTTLAYNATGATAGMLRNLAKQEAHNQQVLRNIAHVEGQAAEQLGGTSAALKVPSAHNSGASITGTLDEDKT